MDNVKNIYKEDPESRLLNMELVLDESETKMVEGVRTYRVYDKVERLTKGSARHNAALYASSLDEVMAAIVVSEETSEVTLFIDGQFVKSFDPLSNSETTRDADGNFIQTESDTKAIEAVEAETETIVSEEDYTTT